MQNNTATDSTNTNDAVKSVNIHIILDAEHRLTSISITSNNLEVELDTPHATDTGSAVAPHTVVATVVKPTAPITTLVNHAQDEASNALYHITATHNS
jgi:hypothetical protein